MKSATGHKPYEKTAATLTAVLPACAAHVAQRNDLPMILNAFRQRGTPALLRFLAWPACHHQTEAAGLEGEARAAHSMRRAAVAAWVDRSTVALRPPYPLLLLAGLSGSLAQTIDLKQGCAPWCLTEAAREHEHARHARFSTPLRKATFPRNSGGPSP
ncbi:hypothetical protein [Streptomyces sp. TP-A0356]|uniref:hypothetical protein n=1 Tax=Streptomyces sp. TP-A0356 TaxID=1359208 RepID=UPI0006E2B7FD|nr:hypothetical protein [Streptomyces sp. TP-A0356]